VKHVVKEEGVLALYRGLAPILIGAVPKAGIRFGSNTYFKGKLQVWHSPAPNVLRMHQ
jgi:solute carrier family 25 citrate transporter 1